MKDSAVMQIVSVSVDVDMIDVTTMPHNEPDPNWEITDSAGHVHRWEGNTLPSTYDREIVHQWYDEGYLVEEWTETRHYCRRCHRRVIPGTRMVDRGKQFIPGLKRYTVEAVSDHLLGDVIEYEGVTLRCVRIVDDVRTFA